MASGEYDSSRVISLTLHLQSDQDNRRISRCQNYRCGLKQMSASQVTCSEEGSYRAKLRFVYWVISLPIQSKVLHKRKVFRTSISSLIQHANIYGKLNARNAADTT